eukprot:TRINITY_DN8336_c0_g1_i1.p1 TRINITY_DN8336_c0_g1~~TRINITY_DN8336_c0_g1_i1.p1  ORF type:complete len:164 (-),score=40.12 TRINITY_DN8336_c0_g1_i1:42-488(-)
MFSSFSLLVILFIALVSCESRGFNDDIDWVNSLDDAKKLAAEQNKPVFVLIHKSWCGACKALRSTFAASSAIAEASKDFIMVNLEDDEEPAGEEWKPDGGYIPRIFFQTKEGELKTDIINSNGNPKYKYFYSSEDQVLGGMKDALAKL